MKTFKLTTMERTRIRSWLEKRPGSSDLPKVWDFDREDGTTLQISRVTQYFGNEAWKVRIAFIVETDYPILMSGPIPGNASGKGGNKKMVPKNYAKADEEQAILDSINPGPTWEQQVAASIKAEINTPSPIWAMIDDLPVVDGKVTFKVGVSDDHKKHMELYQKNVAYYKEQIAGKGKLTPVCQIPACGCAGDVHP